ncbi:HNH endonuclease signature motif containing protein [Providencia sp. PROV223]|uniref:HNH endonuclease signature motif containing protein n=1 Tax=unclassified Providencia TaxID=2633465 RepID=UPI00234A486F|nr:HNH endonuclease signature motif containing protein [Providencia sp. PROV223]
MGKLIDLTNRKFGLWTVLKRNGIKSKCAAWDCLCECGNIRTVSSGHLLNGNSTSCGCVRIEGRRRKTPLPEMSVSRLKEVLSYNDKTGVFTWVTPLSPNVSVGDIAGTVSSHGYIKISIDNVSYMAHRLAWLYMHERWPKGQIDHINRSKGDNRIHNLRDVTQSQNSKNKGLNKNNTSGCSGVYYKKDKRTWIASIRDNGKLKYLGSFKNKEMAITARRNYEKNCIDSDYFY